MCLVLHACGHATDVAMLQAHRCRAAMIVSPCCVGKLVFSPSLAHTKLCGENSAAGHCGTAHPTPSLDAENSSPEAITVALPQPQLHTCISHGVLLPSYKAAS